MGYRDFLELLVSATKHMYAFVQLALQVKYRLPTQSASSRSASGQLPARCLPSMTFATRSDNSPRELGLGLILFLFFRLTFGMSLVSFFQSVEIAGALSGLGTNCCFPN